MPFVFVLPTLLSVCGVNNNHDEYRDAMRQKQRVHKGFSAMRNRREMVAHPYDAEKQVTFLTCHLL